MKTFQKSEINESVISLSKGNQLKFCKDDIWYKKDLFGYEAAAELAVTDLLRQSNLTNIKFAEYDIEQITITGPKMSDDTAIYCESKNFLEAGDRIITAAEILKRAGYHNLNKAFEGKSVKGKIEFLVNTVEEATGIKNFGQYLTTLFELDMFVYNEDRHLNNIAFIEKENGDYEFCPIFDNGASFMSDPRAFKMKDPVNYVRTWVEAKPFTTKFNVQVNMARLLYGQQLEFSKDVKLAESTRNKIREFYGDDILFRIEDTIEWSKERHPELVSCMTFQRNDYEDTDLDKAMDLDIEKE